MANSSKLKSVDCQFREHNEERPARCKKLAQLCNLTLSETPELPKDACDYCVNNNPKPNECELRHDPFKSYYRQIVKASIDPNNKIDPPNHCKSLLPLKVISKMEHDFIGYAQMERGCRAYHTCTLTPASSLKNTCMICDRKFNIDYYFDIEPDYKILKAPPRKGDKVEKWAVGMTVAPRTNPCYEYSLHTIKQAGWDSGLIFSEPGHTVRPDPNWPTVYRQAKLGIFPNFYLGLLELFLRNIDADAFMMVQDDMLFPKGLRSYLESFLWPSDDPHLVHLFAVDSVDDDHNKNEWRSTTMFNGGPNVLIFSHEMMQKVVSQVDIMIRFYAHSKHVRKSSFDDLGIFYWMAEKGYKVYYPRPALVDHIGLHSSHWSHQHESWLWSSTVIARPAIEKIDHWYIGNYDSHGNSRYLSTEKYSTQEIRSKIRRESKSEWVITTRRDKGYSTTGEVYESILEHFNCTEKWVNPALGTVDGKMQFRSYGPILSRIERTEECHTCLEEPDGPIEQIENKILWRKHNVPV